VLHFDAAAYRNVVCLGHIIAADGRKMSKSLGNMFDPWEALDRQGADALRWFMITSGSPWASRRIGHEILDEVLRQFLLTLWNVYSFFVTYANAEGFDPDVGAVPTSDRPLMDRWILSQLARTVRSARAGLEAYDATGAGRAIETFVDDLSNWYVRRSRRRFWNPGGSGGEDPAAAFHTLHECLTTLATLLAPFTPFVAEELWRNLAAGRRGRPASVHLADYPEPRDAEVDPELDEAMEVGRSIVELGRRVRVDHQVRTRQPLSGAVIHVRGDRTGLGEVLDVVQDELNVKQIGFAGSVDELGRWRAKPNYRALGPRLGARVQEVAAALAADDGTLAGQLARGREVTLELAHGEVTVGPSDCELAQEVAGGFGVASDGPRRERPDRPRPRRRRCGGGRDRRAPSHGGRRDARCEDLGQPPARRVPSGGGDRRRAADGHREDGRSELLRIPRPRSSNAPPPATAAAMTAAGPPEVNRPIAKATIAAATRTAEAT
jgi:isoleucyl-tRNA synthetase